LDGKAEGGGWVLGRQQAKGVALVGYTLLPKSWDSELPMVAPEMGIENRV